MKKVLLVLGLNLLLNLSLHAQVEFSLGTGVAGLRNFSPQQKFWAFGQTVQANFHFSARQTAYVWLDYYTEGKFKNNFTAITKIPFTSPLQIPFTATGRLAYRHFSLGWKHYFKGAFNSEKDFTIYGITGFGFLFANVSNSFSETFDTSLYHVPVILGEGKLKKLTFDIGAGGELPLGGNFFAFVDARTWLPASSKTSSYLHSQRNVPLPVMVSAGMRILFGLNY